MGYVADGTRFDEMVVTSEEIDTLGSDNNHTVFYFHFRVKQLNCLTKDAMSEGIGVVLQDRRDSFDAFVAVSAFFFQAKIVELLLMTSKI